MHHFLELCISSVQAAINNLDAEIIVVDNASSDYSCNMVSTLFPKVQLIKNKENVGFSKGNNIGANKAKGEYLCILNPDTVVAEDTFKKIIEFAEKQTNLGAIGCKLNNGAGKFLPESKRQIPYIKAAFKKLLGNTSSYYANHVSENDIGEIDILVGAFMVIKKDIYNDVKGFDEDYFMYGEDIDLSYKLLKLGYQNYYYGKTQVIHFKGESTLRDKNYAKRFYGAMQIFYKKHFKKGFLLDMLVWFGIRTVYLFRNIKIKEQKPISTYIFISNKENIRLQKALVAPVITTLAISNFKENTEIIFDANFLTFKKIIDIMCTHANKKNWTYKILPKNANFIIGSNNAVSKGEVVQF